MSDIIDAGEADPDYAAEQAATPTPEFIDIEALIAARDAELLGATQDLMTTFGWTEARARAVTGYTGELTTPA